MEEINQSEYGVGYAWIINTNSNNQEYANKNAAGNWYCSIPIEVKEGENYLVSIYQQQQGGTTIHCPVLITDLDKNILEKYRNPDSQNNGKVNIFEIIVPPKAKWMLLTTNKNQTSTIQIKKIVSNIKENYSFLVNKNVAIIGDSISTNGNYNPISNPYGNVPEIYITEEDIGKTLFAYVSHYDVYNTANTNNATGMTLNVIRSFNDNIKDESELEQSEITIINNRITLESCINKKIEFIVEDIDVGKMVGKSLTHYPLSSHPYDIIVWWELLRKKLKFNPIPVCWSGASITSHDSGLSRFMTSYAWHKATINKCGIRTPGTMNRIAPDIIIIYRGINDLTHSYSDQSTTGGAKIYRVRPTINSEDNLFVYPGNYPDPKLGTYYIGSGGNTRYGFAEAMLMTVQRLREKYPKAIIVFATEPMVIRLTDNQNEPIFPTNNEINVLQEYNDMIRKLANYLGCQVIEFDKSGLTFENITNYTIDNVHPNAEGHKIMAKRALIDLMKINDFE